MDKGVLAIICSNSFSQCKGDQKKTVATVKILKCGTPKTIAIIVLKIEKFDVTFH